MFSQEEIAHWIETLNHDFLDDGKGNIYLL